MRTLRQMLIGFALPCAASALFSGAVIAFIILTMILPDRLYLRILEREFRQLTHPSGTEVLTVVSDIASTGGSQCCEVLLVGELRSYAIDRKHIEAFYEDEEVCVEFVGEPKALGTGPCESPLPWPYDASSEYRGWEIESLSLEDKTYLVYRKVVLWDTWGRR